MRAVKIRRTAGRHQAVHPITNCHLSLSLSPLSLVLLVYQEVLQECLKRHGMDTPFGLFLKNETARMAECLHKIHSSLQVCLLLTT